MILQIGSGILRSFFQDFYPSGSNPDKVARCFIYTFASLLSETASPIRSTTVHKWISRHTSHVTRHTSHVTCHSFRGCHFGRHFSCDFDWHMSYVDGRPWNWACFQTSGWSLPHHVYSLVQWEDCTVLCCQPVTSRTTPPSVVGRDNLCVKSTIDLSICLYVYLSLYLSIHLSIHQSVRLSVCLSMYLSIYPSVN